MDIRNTMKAEKKKYLWAYTPASNRFNPVNKSKSILIENNKKNYVKNNKIESQCFNTENGLANEKSEVNTINQKPYINKSSVSIVTCTNRNNYLSNIFDNFSRQCFKDKELIIILNNDKLNLDMWKNKSIKNKNIKIFQVAEQVTLGECLNYAIKKSNYEIIAKFDDDDYYGANYLNQAINALQRTNAHVVGKSTSYVYFENTQTLAIRNPRRENRFIYRVEGPTLVFKKEILSQISFSDKNLGEDVEFCRDCCKNNFKIFSTDKENFVYIRHGKRSQHTWAINDDYYLKLCTVVGQMNDFSNYVN